MAFIAARGGRNGVFYIRVPKLVAGIAPAQGQFVNLIDDERLYMATRVVDDGLELTPVPLSVAVPVPLASVESLNVYLRCSLSDDVQSFESDRVGYYRYELRVVERLV